MQEGLLKIQTKLAIAVAAVTLMGFAISGVVTFVRTAAAFVGNYETVEEHNADLIQHTKLEEQKMESLAARIALQVELLHHKRMRGE